MSDPTEITQVLVDQIAGAQLSRRRFLMAAGAAGLTVGLSGAMVPGALAAGEIQTINQESQMHKKAFTPDNTKTKDDSVSDTLADLMLKNLSEVFGERDSERRMAAIKKLYSEDAVFFEAEHRFQGRQAISDAVAALQASSPVEFGFSAVAPPARNHDVGRLFWRLGPAGSPPVVNGMDIAQFKDGRIQSLYVFLNDQDH